MSSNGINHLFVYGSLRSGFRSQAYEYISRYFTLVGNAKVKGLLYDMGNYPAGVESTTDHYIVGELYVLKEQSEFDWAFAQLDDYEGTNMEPGETPLYRRNVTVSILNETPIPAWIFWYVGDTNGRPVIESGDILEYLKSKK
jgi:gamma-glutamylcyclotransferase (GGCT)/AIG2-like uncharacterized protein YtfP